ncbi:hypothetical protein PR048_012310 [Dryococelus australis]|uniref:Uncharacterized protein n=1 Tax=Dryococelus australis TaxID=614101 RepID=A0ABQ9HPR9_9NEOP|nr:hypothetical protein PR048_012310 [Dryococelus australis]
MPISSAHWLSAVTVKGDDWAPFSTSRDRKSTAFPLTYVGKCKGNKDWNNCGPGAKLGHKTTLMTCERRACQLLVRSPIYREKLSGQIVFQNTLVQNNVCDWIIRIIGQTKFALLFGTKLNVTVLYALEPTGGAVASAFASHIGDPGSIPGGFAPGFSHVGIVLDDAARRRPFSGNSRFPRPCIPAPLHPRASFHVMFRDDGHLRVPAGKPVTRRVLPRPEATPHTNLLLFITPFLTELHRFEHRSKYWESVSLTNRLSRIFACRNRAGHASARRVLSAIFRFRYPCIPALLHTHLASQLSFMFRAAQISPFRSFISHYNEMNWRDASLMWANPSSGWLCEALGRGFLSDWLLRAAKGSLLVMLSSGKATRFSRKRIPRKQDFNIVLAHLQFSFRHWLRGFVENRLVWCDHGISQVGIVPDDTAGRGVFSVISRFPCPLILALLHTHLNHPHRLSRPRC